MLKNFFGQQYKEKVIFQSLQRKGVRNRLPLNIVTITRQIRHGLFVQRLRRNVSCLLQGKHRLHWFHILSKHEQKKKLKNNGDSHFREMRCKQRTKAMRVKWRKRNILSLNFLAELTFSLNKTTSNLLGQLQIRFIYVSLFFLFSIEW